MPRFLLRDLALIGARTDDDAPVSSGFATIYVSNTTTLATAYADETSDEALAQPILLDETGRATIWVDRPVRLLIQDAASVTVFDKDPADTIAAKAATLDNAGWPGARDMDEFATKLATSLGGDDGKYREDAGAEDVDVHTHLGERWVSVKSFKAKGDNLEDDRNAIIAAYTYITQHTVKGGRGILYFPPGIYRLSSSFPIVDPDITFEGAGTGQTYLRFFGADSDGVWVKAAANIRALTIDFDGLSTGVGLRITDTSNVDVAKVSIGGAGTASDGFLHGIRIENVALPDGESCENFTFDDVKSDCAHSVGATGRALVVPTIEDQIAVKNLRILGGSYNTADDGVGDGIPIDLQSARDVLILKTRVSSGAKGIVLGENADAVAVLSNDFTARPSGADLEVSQFSDFVTTLGNDWKTGVTDLHVATDPGQNNVYADLSQYPVFNGGQVRTYADNDTFTPDLDKGNFYKLTVAAGKTLIIAAPTSSFDKRVGQRIGFELSGDSAAFTFNAIFVGLSSAVRGTQYATWDGTNWVAGTPKESGLQVFTPATGDTVNPVAAGGTVVITVTGGGAGIVTINNPSGPAATGDRLTFILKGHDDLTSWNWDGDYHEEARYADDTASGIAFMAANKTGAIGVVTFVYDGAAWCLDGGARDGAGAGQRPLVSGVLNSTLFTPTAPATVTPDRTLSDTVEIQATGDGGVGSVTINAPSGAEFEGSRMRLVLSIVGVTLFSWTLGAGFRLPDADDPSPIATETDGWPLTVGKMGIIHFEYSAGQWNKVNASGIITV